MSGVIAVKDRDGNAIGIAKVDPVYGQIKIELLTNKSVTNLLNALVLKGEMSLEDRA